MELIDPSLKQRIYSIDILRGIIMVIMALDHVRDYFTNAQFDPLDLTKTSPILFFTRIITHLCAPTFVFLSGTSAFLSLSKKKNKKAASIFLIKRGLWLLLLELTIIGFGFQFDIGFHMVFAQVIWAIGCSMLVLSLLIHLKPAYIAIIGLVLIFGHDVLDHINADSFGHDKLLWLMLHQQGFYAFNNYESIFVLYPILPWIGIMAVGYAFGTYFKLNAEHRKALFYKIGLSSLVLFVILRFINKYGDPFPWQPQTTLAKNIMAFIKVNKYPPSLFYVLLMLGISITALAFLENVNNKITNIFKVYGRVPMFYYLLHIYLIHGLAGLILYIKYGLSPFSKSLFDPGPAGWGYNLPIIYLIWLGVVIILYFPCRWFVKIKQTRSDWWLSYI